MLLMCACLYISQNARNPVEDFCRTPPGILALSNMVYFAKNYRENYTKVSSIDLQLLISEAMEIITVWHDSVYTVIRATSQPYGDRQIWGCQNYKTVILCGTETRSPTQQLSRKIDAFDQ